MIKRLRQRKICRSHKKRKTLLKKGNGYGIIDVQDYFLVIVPFFLKVKGVIMDKELKFLLYSTPQEDVNVNVVVKDENLWLTQSGMAELFDCTADNISLHLKNIYNEGELDFAATTEKISVVRQEGSRQVNRTLDFYNLDAIIAVGYRVNSHRATQFRIWATNVLKEYIRKGFVLDDDRLKQGQTAFGKDYFQELLERVRSIRASERRIWQQITDIFAECSIDYDKNDPITHEFYAMVQNKFHYAITGQTALIAR